MGIATFPEQMSVFAVLGGSGNVGKAIVRHLVEDSSCSRVVLIGRREVEEFKSTPKVQQHIVDMNQLRNESEVVLKKEGVQACFVAMGVGKPREVSASELENIDVTLPTEFAIAAKSAGVTHMSLLTSAAADINHKPSRLTGTSAGGGLYLHLKGKVEENFKSQGFSSLSIFRPGTLLGNSNTPGFLDWFAPKIRCVLPENYRDIHINDLGGVMVLDAKVALASASNATKTYEGRSLFELVNQLGRNNQS
eukprot:c17487_g1_i1.p1 GENE.c17487_g1_i1~~c17487_g1_i1.p1  ORF type:complete len:250 (+),score=42.04 c17487_g1_i1:1-750(+)